MSSEKKNIPKEDENMDRDLETVNNSDLGVFDAINDVRAHLIFSRIL